MLSDPLKTRPPTMAPPSQAQVEPPGRPRHEDCTMAHLVETVGVPILHVLTAPRGLECPVSGTVVYDPVELLPDGPDALLLCSGMRVDDPSALNLVRSASARGYCALVVKPRSGDTAALVAEASALGLGILAAPEDVSWRRLDALLMSVLGARGTGADHAPGVGDELFALANAIAAITGGSVAIEDLDRQVLAYSSIPGQRIDELRQAGILARRVPDMSRNLWQYRQVLAAEDVVSFEEVADEMARSAITIRAGSRPLGTIWAIERPGGLPPAGHRALLDGARLAAVHLLRARDAGELDLHARDSALRGALDGSWTPREAAFRLSLPIGTELSLVGFAPAPVDNEPPPLITQVGSVLTRYFAAFRPEAAVATTSRAVFVLLPTGGAATAHRLATGALNAFGKDFDNQLRGAVAYTSTDPGELPAMRKEIEDVLAVTTTREGLPTLARLADVHARVVLARVADVLAQEPRLRHPGVDAMTAYDRDHRTDYARSVTAWLDSVGEVATAARQLRVHPNTLRYRLKRADELFTLHLDKPDGRLSAWMQLRLEQ